MRTFGWSALLRLGPVLICSATACTTPADRVSCSIGSYFSVPQIGQYYSSSVNEMKDAIASIPAYIERCSHCTLLASPQPPPRAPYLSPPVSQFSLSSQRCGTTTFPTSRATTARGSNVAGAGVCAASRLHGASLP